MWCSGVPGEEFTAALWATMPGAAERPTGWPAVGGELQDRLSENPRFLFGAAAARHNDVDHPRSGGWVPTGDVMPMPGNPRRRFWVESVLASVSALLAIVTAISREWIELLTGWDPDHGDGSLEWAIVAGLALVAVVAGITARLERRRLHPAPES